MMMATTSTRTPRSSTDIAEGLGEIGPLEATSALKAPGSHRRPCLSRRAAGPRVALGILAGAPASF